MEYALIHSEIIEKYPTDHPHPGCLVLGFDISGEKLHIVCGLAPEELWMITAYRPDSKEWESDFKARKGKKL